MAYDVTIVELPAKRLVGLSERVNMSEYGEKCPALWEKFISRMSEVNDVAEEFFYGASVDMEEDGSLNYWVTAAVSPQAKIKIPAGMSELSVRAGKYATHVTSLESLGDAYTYLYGEWAKTRPVDFTSACFERYAREWREGDPIELYVPLL
ncbi:MAG: GyrI-like domain-containing protein [Synergistaceae bacterium]|jgi:predicted transcriptional regulator YdeE|nr:GyrI-like domain-containing protein [Synergistaceae bacterium]